MDWENEMEKDLLKLSARHSVEGKLPPLLEQIWKVKYNLIAGLTKPKKTS